MEWRGWGWLGRILDDYWGVISHPQLQKQDFLSLMFSDIPAVPLRCLIPAFILNKGIIGTKVHGKGLSAMRAAGHQFRGNPHLFLLPDHFTDDLLIIPGLLAAGL